MKSTYRVLVALSLLWPVAAAFAQHDQAAHSPYAGMETRAIKSLSEADVEELRRGGGWGLALPAELNGMPGPAHLLEMKDMIPLSSDQVDRLELLYEDMLEKAIPAGERLIAAEAAIEAAFASGKVDETSLRALLAEAEAARTDLRFIHLSQHYKTVPLLGPRQITRYIELRGYASDPCDRVPEGHDPERYRKHMSCD